MSDYGTLKSTIASEMSRSDLTTLIPLAIQEAIAHYSGHMFWFNQERATASTVASQEYYDLPLDFRKMHWLYVLSSDGSSSSEIEQVSMPTIEERYSSTLEGEPQMFSVWREEYRLWPIPDAVYTLKLFYAKELDELEDDADTNAWMIEGVNLIKYRAKYLLYMNKIRDENMATAMKVLEGEALKELRMTTQQFIQKPKLSMPRNMPVGSGGWDYRHG